MICQTTRTRYETLEDTNIKIMKIDEMSKNEERYATVEDANINIYEHR